jgi:hypothetical protein
MISDKMAEIQRDNHGHGPPVIEERGTGNVQQDE